MPDDAHRRPEGVELQAELDVAIDLARRGGTLALDVRREKRLQTAEKAGDMGVVTAADRAINDHVVSGLQAAFPDDAIIAEEDADDVAATATRERTGGLPSGIDTATRTWFVDPIDGTREYADGRDEFAVMIGLVVDGTPRLGVIFKPTSAMLVSGITGAGVICTTDDTLDHDLRISRKRALDEATIMRSRSHPSQAVDRLCDAVPIARQRKMGSMGLKMIELATGRADVYVNLSGKSSLWDSAAPEAILTAAGGRVTDRLGDRIEYAEPSTLRLSRGLVASNGLLHDALIRAIGALGDETTPASA